MSPSFVRGALEGVKPRQRVVEREIANFYLSNALLARGRAWLNCPKPS